MTEIPKHLQKRLVPPVYFLASIMASVYVDRYAPVWASADSPDNWRGASVSIGGLVLAIAGNRTCVRNETALRPFTKSTALVQSGVFKVSRNPMYLGMTLVLLGGSIYLGSLSALLTVPLFPLLIQWLFIRKEEELLTETFGQAYLDYKAKVRRWL